jgi:hypothetical protein
MVACQLNRIMHKPIRYASEKVYAAENRLLWLMNFINTYFYNRSRLRKLRRPFLRETPPKRGRIPFTNMRTNSRQFGAASITITPRQLRKPPDRPRIGAGLKAGIGRRLGERLRRKAGC